MIITYYAKACVKVQQGDTVIGFNPISKDSKEKYARFGANIALISRNAPAFNGAENLSYADKLPFVVNGPGEYEVGGIFIKGYAVPHEGVYNTVYTLRLDEINLCHLGGLSAASLPPEVVEALGEIDVLFVPVWKGDDIVAPLDAHKIANNLEPKIIIPMHNGDMGKDSAFAVFMKESGEDAQEPAEKLTLKRKDLEGKEASVVLLSTALG